MRFLWTLWWLFDWFVLVPQRRRWNAWRPTVTIAVWAHEHGWHWLERAIQRYWRARNWWRFDVWTRVDRVLYKLTLPLRPKCPACKQALFSFGFCFGCSWSEAVRKNKLERLTGGRSRTLER